MLNPDGRPVPAGPGRESFHIVRQALSHNDIDYLAVMESRALLREWSDSGWPDDGFTLDENRADLAGHIEDDESHAAYGYSILTSDGERLLGSLYLDPVAPFMDRYDVEPGTAEVLSRFDVRIEYWLRNGTDERIERRLIAAVSEWLDEAWWFRRPVFGSRTRSATRRRLYESEGLREVATMTSHDGSRTWYFHARPDDPSEEGRHAAEGAPPFKKAAES